MSLSSVLPKPGLSQTEVPSALLASEVEFYGSYRWCLNPHLTFRDAADKLKAETEKLLVVRLDWQVREVATHIYLLSCGLLNCVDEFLRGSGLQLRNQAASIPMAPTIARLFETARLVSARNGAFLHRWRGAWASEIATFLDQYVSDRPLSGGEVLTAAKGLVPALEATLPSELLDKRLSMPSPFSRLDLTPDDVIALGCRLIERFPDRSQPILLLGLRTSGSYFAPLIKAVLKHAGYETIEILTVEPSKGAGTREARELQRLSARNFVVVIIDDPPRTGAAIMSAVSIACDAGFPRNRVAVAVPTVSSAHEWLEELPNPELAVTLESEKWRKRALLNPSAVQTRLQEYFSSSAIDDVQVVDDQIADQINAHLRTAVSEPRSSRLKQVYAVKVRSRVGNISTRYVLAKSVGSGWFSYHSFLIGSDLRDFVPRILGLRDGILYMDWIFDESSELSESDIRESLIRACASYISARMRRLSLNAESAAGLDLRQRNNGVRILEKSLSRAYGTPMLDTLMRSRVGKMLRHLPCPCPTLIDGNMQRSEWVFRNQVPLKVDYEHHGMGKSVLNVVDPAYDLADTILNLKVSSVEEKILVDSYIARSGDAGVVERLFLNKLMAGLWNMAQAQEQLFSMPKAADQQQKIHRRFMLAWDFLTLQTARYCGKYCDSPKHHGWSPPLLALDIDGVIDRRPFGFPSTTAAGIEAISLLHSHEITVAVNTARSAGEVMAYCDAYSFAGGIAEHGSYLWDAIGQRGRVLVGAEALKQLEMLRKRLEQIPGVFIDDRHQYSVRAFIYRDRPRGFFSWFSHSIRFSDVGDGAVAPVPTVLINQILAEPQFDQLCFHQTNIDTTVLTRDVNKGTGLASLRDWVLDSNAETIAVGDNSADLPAFRVATRGFAPANINCRKKARLLGCAIAKSSYQRGLLEIARTITASRSDRALRSTSSDIVINLLEAVDRSWLINLFIAVFSRQAFKIFIR